MNIPQVFDSGRPLTDHWLSQAPYLGSEIGECFSTAHLITDGDNESWLREWEKTAHRVEGLARACLARGHRVSAREAFLRATTYYEAAFFYLPERDPRKRELYDHHRDCFRSAGALFGTACAAVTTSCVSRARGSPAPTSSTPR